MTREEFIEKLQMAYFGSKEATEEIVTYYDKLTDELSKYKEVNKKAIDKILCWGETLNPTFQKELLKILEGVEDEN